MMMMTTTTMTLVAQMLSTSAPLLSQIIKYTFYTLHMCIGLQLYITQTWNSVCTHVMIHRNSSSCGYDESKQDTEHPGYTHDDDNKISCGTRERKVIKNQNDIEQLAAKCPSIVKHKEFISFTITSIEISWWRWRKVSISESDTSFSSLITEHCLNFNQHNYQSVKVAISESDNRRSSLSDNILSKLLLSALYWWVKMVASIKLMAIGKFHAALM